MEKQTLGLEGSKAKIAFYTTARHVNSCENALQIPTAENLVAAYRNLYPSERIRYTKLVLLLQLKRIELVAAATLTLA